MGIQSTKHITRGNAIGRVVLIALLILNRNYRKLEEKSFEDEYNLQNFVDNGLDFKIGDIKKWTNKMIEDILDRPFFRESMFDNYLIDEED